MPGLQVSILIKEDQLANMDGTVKAVNRSVCVSILIKEVIGLR